MNEVLLILGMTAVTFLPRVLPMALANRLNLPKTVVQALNYVPIAVLTIIVVQSTLYTKGNLNLDWNNPYLWAVLTSAVIVKLQNKLLLSIVAGLVVYAILRFNLLGF